MSNYEVPEYFEDFINLDNLTKMLLLRDHYDKIPIEWEPRIATGFTFISPYRFAVRHVKTKLAIEYILHVYKKYADGTHYLEELENFAMNPNLSQEQQFQIFDFSVEGAYYRGIKGLAKNPNLSPYVALAIACYLDNDRFNLDFIAATGCFLAKSEKISKEVVNFLFKLDFPIITSTLAQNPSVSDELINEWMKKLGEKHEDE